jgi:hypothetical protein
MPGQWLAMAGSAVMILHGFRAGSPVVTDTGCCLSAARRANPTFGATIRIARVHHACRMS